MKRKPEKTIVYNPEWEPEGTRERYRCVENASRGLRIVGAVHEVARREGWRFDHDGWYLDPFGYGEVARGYVLQLPARDGEPLYVPAILEAWNPDCYVCDFHSCTSDLRDAIHWADGMAERYAEREREYQLAESAKLRAEELREEAREARAQHRALVAEMRAARARDVFGAPWPTICARLREDLTALRQQVRDALRKAAALEADPSVLLQ